MTEKCLSPFKYLIRSLNYRNYRLYFGGQGISHIGTWIQTIAISWLVYELTNSALYLGVVGFVTQIPILFFGSLAGVLVDRWNRHRTLILTQILAMVQAFILAALVLTGKVYIWQIIILSLMVGVVASFELTVSQTFLFNIIEKKEDLGNAIALNSLLVNLARMLGPSIAGILIAQIGEGLCFFVNGVSYIAVILALLGMKVKPQQIKPGQEQIKKELMKGFLYVWNSAPIKYIILLQAFISLIGMPFQVLMPVFVKEILREGPNILGFIMGCSGIGAIIATLYLAQRKDVRGLAKLIPLAAGILGSGLIASSLSRLPFLSMFFALFTGFGAVLLMAAGSTIVQRIVNDDVRGRVMSIYTMAFLGIYPFGNLLAGGLANIMGVPYEYMLSGFLCIVGSLVFAAKYPLISDGINQASIETIRS